METEMVLSRKMNGTVRAPLIFLKYRIEIGALITKKLKYTYFVNVMDFFLSFSFFLRLSYLICLYIIEYFKLMEWHLSSTLVPEIMQRGATEVFLHHSMFE